jgi:hypothetical protein
LNKKITPIAIVSRPRTTVIAVELLEIFDPSDPNIAPYEMNRVEKPKTKRVEPRAARPLLLTSVMPAA